MKPIERRTKHRIRTLAEKLLLAHVKAKGIPDIGLERREQLTKDAVAVAELFDNIVFPVKP